MSYTGLPERAALVQRELSDTIGQLRPTAAKTLASFEQGTRNKQARLAGLQIGFFTDRAHGQTLYSPIAGDTSFKKATKQKTRAMYANVVFRNMNMQVEDHVLQDMNRGYIPDSYIKERQRRIDTHMWKKNRAAIGDGTASVAAVSSASSSTVTVLADNSARGTAAGHYFLAVSDSSDPILYDAVDPATDTVKATFYITAKPTSTTITVVFTFGNAAAMNANTYMICESGQWKKELFGLAYHISDSTSRIYQGADVSLDPGMQNLAISASNAVVTPTMIHSALGSLMTRCNVGSDEFGFIGHITPLNYRDLAKFGYTARQYTVNDGQKAKTTYGLPNQYQDTDIQWVLDAEYEDCFIDLREKAPYFEYVQKDFGLKQTDGIGRHEWSGLNGAGSTQSYENYNEAVNIVWDMKGSDGSGPENGKPNTAVFIKSIALNASAKYANQA